MHAPLLIEIRVFYLKMYRFRIGAWFLVNWSDFLGILEKIRLKPNT